MNQTQSSEDRSVLGSNSKLWALKQIQERLKPKRASEEENNQKQLAESESHDSSLGVENPAPRDRKQEFTKKQPDALPAPSSVAPQHDASAATKQAAENQASVREKAALKDGHSAVKNEPSPAAQVSKEAAGPRNTAETDKMPSTEAEAAAAKHSNGNSTPPQSTSSRRESTPPAAPAPSSSSSPSRSLSSAQHELALRHPKEELLKPTRWDTHSWLPLLPASGLLCLHGHDVLGFPIDESNSARLKAWSESYMETVAQQRVRWMSFLGAHTGVLDEATRSKMRLLVRLGVPPELRHRVWRLTTGSFQKQRQAHVSYDELLRRYEGVPSLFDDQIKKDLSRTLPAHNRYAQAEARAALGRVLGCYARWQPTIGYCQGMNFVCGILLLIMAEEDTFWLLAAIVEDVLPGFYHPSLIGVNSDTHTLHDLVAIKLPAVAADLESLGLDREALCSVYVAWFMCLFNQLPSESMLRVWDLLLFEGSKALFKASLALLSRHAKLFADLANAVHQGLIPKERGGHEALQALRRLPQEAIDPNELVSTATNDLGSVPKTLLQRLRLHNCRRVLSEGFIEEVFLKQSRPLLQLRNHQNDDTRKTLLVTNWDGDNVHGSFVWSGDEAGAVCIWDAQTGCCLRRTRTAYQRRVCSMAATRHTAGHVWVGCQGGVICTFDTRTFELWGILAGHTQDVLAIARVGSNMWTAAGHVVWVWDNCESSDPQVKKELNCFGKDILSLLASRSGLFVLCGSIAGFVVLDALSCATLAVGSVAEGITQVVEVSRWGGAEGADSKVGGEGSEVWCIHGNSVLGCWDSRTFSSGQCKHLGHGKVSCLTALHNGEVWSGGDDGSVCVWNAKNKRVIRALRGRGAPVSSMVAVENHLLGVLTVWVAHFDGKVDVWVASELSAEHVQKAHNVRNEWRARREDLGLIRDLRFTLTLTNPGLPGHIKARAT